MLIQRLEKYLYLNLYQLERTKLKFKAHCLIKLQRHQKYSQLTLLTIHQDFFPIQVM
jgi:hypothetical protein